MTLLGHDETDTGTPVRVGWGSFWVEFSPRRLWVRLRRWFLPIPWLDLVKPCDARITFTVSADDEGVADVDLTVANFSKKAIAVVDVDVDWIEVSNGSLSDLTARMKVPECRIEARSLKTVQFRIKLGAPDVRKLQHAIAKPRNRYSSPGARAAVNGHLTVRGRNDFMPFTVEDITPFLNLYNPSSQDEDT